MPKPPGFTNQLTAGAERLEPFIADVFFDSPCKALWISSAGHVKVVCVNDSDENGRVLQNVQIGWLVIRATKVIAAGTTATVGMVAY